MSRLIRSNFFSVIIAALPGICTMQMSAAQDFEDRLEPPETIYLEDTLVISAFRYETDQFNRPEALAILTRRQIDRRQPMSTPDLVSVLPGVWMQKTNLGGGSPYIRGLTGYQTLLLVDGIRLNNSTFRSGPNQYLNTVDPFMVDRVEVLRGSGSVQYGSDAIGGTLHLRSRELQFGDGRLKLGGNAYGKYWSDNMEKTGRIGLHGAGKSVSFAGGLTLKSLGDITRGGGEKQVPTGYDERAADLKIKTKINPMHSITGAYQHLRQSDVPLFHQIDRGNFSEFVFDPQQRDLAYLRWNAEYASPIVRNAVLTVSGQRAIEGRSSVRTGSVERNVERDEVNTLGVVFETLSAIRSNWTASSGVEFYYDHVGSEAITIDIATGEGTGTRGLYPDGSTYRSLAVYTLHDITAGAWSFSFGARYNAFRLSVKDAVFGNTTITPGALVGNIGAVFAIDPRHHLVASANTGFRAPNLNDVSSFGIADFRFEVPSYNLKPERSLNKEIGYKYRSEKYRAGISLYHNNLFDLITNQPSTFNGMDSLDGFKVYKRQNSKKAKIMGVELQGEATLARGVSLNGHLTYTHGQNISDSEPMRRIPPLNGRLGVQLDLVANTWFLAEWQCAGSQTRLSSGDMADFRIAEGGTPGWHLFHVHAGYERSWLSVNAGIHNITDTRYRTHGSGIDGLGRSVWISLALFLNRMPG